MIKKKAYLIGIKGVAMTALAVYLKQSGWQVTGSDTKEIFSTDRVLAELDIPVKIGFSSQNIKGKFDLIVVTGAHGGMTNPEAIYARKLNFPIYMHGEFLGKLMQGKIGISIAGCHGKTTTSSLTASLLMQAGYDPSYVIGTAGINGLGPAGHSGRGNFIIVEADEYMTCPETCRIPRFLWQTPKILVITNIEYDHPDAFSNIREVKNAFISFTQKVESGGVIIVCVDNNNIREILPQIKRKIVTYGFSSQADYQVEGYYYNAEVSFFRLRYKGVDLGEYLLKIPGKHNILNAVAASITANQIGVSWDKIRQYLKLYTGCKRRFEKIGQYQDIALYDDYAHHPTEIRATISAAADWFRGRRIIVIFQPHTYSRTKTLIKDFAKSFVQADIAIITDIYPSAREEFDSTITSSMLVSQANKFKNNAFYQRKLPEVLSFMRQNLKRGDLIITMGAGDIFLWHNEIIKLIKKEL